MGSGGGVSGLTQPRGKLRCAGLAPWLCCQDLSEVAPSRTEEEGRAQSTRLRPAHLGTLQQLQQRLEAPHFSRAPHEGPQKASVVLSLPSFCVPIPERDRAVERVQQRAGPDQEL